MGHSEIWHYADGVYKVYTNINEVKNALLDADYQICNRYFGNNGDRGWDFVVLTENLREVKALIKKVEKQVENREKLEKA